MDGLVLDLGSTKKIGQSSQIRIYHERERVVIDPDLAWIERNWTDLEPYPLEAGVLPWEHLKHRICMQSSVSVRRKYVALLEQLLELKEELERDP
jgi:hypothetical protein